MYKKEWKLRAAVKHIQPISIRISELLMCILGSKPGPVSPSIRINSGGMGLGLNKPSPKTWIVHRIRRLATGVI